MDTIIYFTGKWEEDCLIMKMILDEVEFKSGTARRMMYAQKAGTGGSMLYGLTWKSYLSPTKNRTQSEYKGLFYTKPVDDHPELKIIFKQFRDLYFKDFDYTQVQMNKNFHCGPHKDSTNVGESILVGFGDFTGGLTYVNYDGDLKSYNIKNNFVKFNGAKYEHWVSPFKGTRYTLVFFDNLKNHKKIPFTSIIANSVSFWSS